MVPALALAVVVATFIVFAAFVLALANDVEAAHAAREASRPI